MNILGAVISGALSIIILFGSRRWAVVGLSAGVLYLTQGQALNFFGIELYAIRLLTLVAILRVLVKRESSQFQATLVDKVLVAAFAYTTVVYVVAENGPVLRRFALMIDAFICYFSFRCLIRSLDDFVWFLRVLAIVLIPYVIISGAQLVTGHNPFGYFGGAFDGFIRGERPRCMGSFRHPSTFGTFGASFLPLFIGLWLAGKKNLLPGVLGIMCCCFIVYLSNSGGPVSSAALGIVGWLFWKARGAMHVVRRSVVVGLVFLAIVMKAPIWYLPAKVSGIIGGDGWHRSYLMDVAIQDLGKWWFAGMHVLETKEWFPYVVVTGGVDLINFYLDFGVAGGLVAVGLCVWLLVSAFRLIGDALRCGGSAGPQSQEIKEQELILWGLGVTLVVHVVNFFGLVYFDQLYVTWYLQLAAISSVSMPLLLKDTRCVKDQSAADRQRRLRRQVSIVTGTEASQLGRSKDIIDPSLLR